MGAMKDAAAKAAQNLVRKANVHLEVDIEDGGMRLVVLNERTMRYHLIPLPDDLAQHVFEALALP